MPEFTVDIDVPENIRVKREDVLERLGGLLADDEHVLGPAAALHGDDIGATFQIEADSVDAAATRATVTFLGHLLQAYFDVLGRVTYESDADELRSLVKHLRVERCESREPVPA